MSIDYDTYSQAKQMRSQDWQFLKAMMAAHPEKITPTPMRPYEHVAIHKKRSRAVRKVLLLQTDKQKAEEKHIKTIQQALQHVCKWHNITLDELKGNDRFKHLVAAREYFIEIAKFRLDRSTTQIGAALGRDHSTIVHYLPRIRARRELAGLCMQEAA